MLILDMQTFFLTMVIGHLFSAILLSAYWRTHQKDRTINTFFFAKLTQAVAWFLVILRGGVTDILTVSAANTLLFIGTALEISAILYLRDEMKKRTKRFYQLLTLCLIAGFHLIIFLQNEENLRIAFASVGTALYLIFPACRMARERTSSSLMRMMGSFYFLVVMAMLGRAAAALWSEESMSFFAPGIYQTLSFIGLYLIMISGNTGFILLLKEWTDQELIKLATLDDLTGLLNRRTFIDKAQRVLKDCAKKKKPLTLLLFDIDSFKQINDTFGHDAGDRVLKELAARITRIAGTKALFARYGGDEFAILLAGADEWQSAKHAELIRSTVERASQHAEVIPHTISIGLLTVMPDSRSELQGLYTTCDQALYAAKRNGRNCISRGNVNHSALA